SLFDPVLGASCAPAEGWDGRDLSISMDTPPRASPRQHGRKGGQIKPTRSPQATTPCLGPPPLATPNPFNLSLPRAVVRLGRAVPCPGGPARSDGRGGDLE